MRNEPGGVLVGPIDAEEFAWAKLQPSTRGELFGDETKRRAFGRAIEQPGPGRRFADAPGIDRVLGPCPRDDHAAATGLRDTPEQSQARVQVVQVPLFRIVPAAGLGPPAEMEQDFGTALAEYAATALRVFEITAYDADLAHEIGEPPRDRTGPNERRDQTAPATFNRRAPGAIR